MNTSYLDAKVREALVASRGSKAGAQALLMNWAAQDELLLRAMAQPFLKAIAGAAVATAGKRGVSVAPQIQSVATGVIGPRGRAASTPAPTLSKEALAKILDRVGQNDTPAPAAVVSKGQVAPPGQANALKTLAAAYMTKRRG